MAKTVKQTSLPTQKNLFLRPLMGYILIEPSSAENRTASGIILPESAQEKPAQGKVVATGPDIVNELGRMVVCPVKVGDVVVYKKWGGDEIKVGGKEYKLVRFDDLMGVIEED